MKEIVRQEVAKEISRQANEYGVEQFNSNLPSETRKQCNKSINHLQQIAINIFGLKTSDFRRIAK